MSTASSAATSTTPRSSESSGVEYVNTGDWVESCTAVVENFDGSMEILHWAHVLADARPPAAGFVPVVIEGDAAEAA